ncbi:MAG: sodium-dependent transporter [Rhodothermales bacterium]|nr:sodium-dependent transporter [Rhodothermales bacterium]
MAIAPSDRGLWTSKTGFILAAAGSAIGLGNIWRFPFTAGENGGGAFVLIYLMFVALIGIPVLLAELSIGRQTERNPVGAFKALVPGSWWPVVGGLGVATGFGILSFYSVIAGWTLAYLYKAIVGGFGMNLTAADSEAIFGEIVGDPLLAIVLTVAFLLLTILVVRGGVSGGIERATKVLMPLLFILLVILAIRAVTLPGAMEGVSYLFKPDFSEITTSVAMNALGQALFSLSLGMGAMITYGSYFPKSENLPIAGVSVAVFDTLIAVLAGLIIFPALFAVGVEPGAGPSLVFVVLPTIFDSLPAGGFFAIAFYFLLTIAALTSTISLLEVVVSYFVDERGWSRNKAAWVLGSTCMVLAVPSALSQGANATLTNMAGGGFLNLQNIIWGNFSLSIGALLICVFVGWKWGVPAARASLEGGGFALPAAGLWSFLIRFVCPVAVAIVLIFIIVTGNYF